jgi:hypothetical protein
LTHNISFASFGGAGKAANACAGIFTQHWVLRTGGMDELNPSAEDMLQILLENCVSLSGGSALLR